MCQAMTIWWLFLLLSCQGVAQGAFATHFAPRSAKASGRPIRREVRGGGSFVISTDGLSRSTPASSDLAFERTVAAAAAGELPEVMPELPSLAQYRRFYIPCLGLWAAGPLLSLVDTAFVGLSGSPAESAQQLAALGPATTFFDGATFLFAFLNVATTNLYSSARAQAGEDSDRAESVVRSAAQVAINCGVGIMFFILLCSRPLLRLYIGGHVCDQSPALLNAAVDYVNIRAFSMPTSLLLGVVQAALLGAQDSVTPLVAIFYSTIVNVVGDFFLVKVLGWGLQGAALATTAAQWAGTAALLEPARRRLLRDRSLRLWRSKTAVADGVTGRSFLGFAAPVLTLIVGKLAAFGFMTNSAAAVPGQPTPLASHQVILSLLFFCSPFFEVISQTAQTFMPIFLAPLNAYIQGRQEREPGRYQVDADVTVQKWRRASQQVATQLLGLGGLVAGVVATVAALLPLRAGHFITSDPSVQQAVRPLAKYLWMGALLSSPVAVAEGVLLARRELVYLASIYLASTLLLPPALLQVKVRHGHVGHVWACFVVFQLFRALSFTAKVWGPSLWRGLGDRLRGTRGSTNNQPAQEAKI